MSHISKKYLNQFNSKNDIVTYLNKNGYFWEYSNKVTSSISDDELILKSLLYLEFEDMQQLFDLYGFQRCKNIWKANIESAPKEYYGIIARMLKIYFFR